MISTEAAHLDSEKEIIGNFRFLLASFPQLSDELDTGKAYLVRWAYFVVPFLVILVISFVSAS
jgi:hypothetical protein